MSNCLYRVQDSEGRGPFRPGFTHKWISGDGCGLVPWYEEMDVSGIESAHKRGLHIGTACRSIECLYRWFRRPERRRLKKLGYHIVMIDADEIIGESENQVLFARRLPLSKGVIPYTG